jgi:hypothetical protein
MKKRYGIYSVTDYPEQNGGKWGGFRCSVVQSTAEQPLGKLYVKSDGRSNYSAAEKLEPKLEPEKGTSEDLEI